METDLYNRPIENFELEIVFGIQYRNFLEIFEIEMPRSVTVASKQCYKPHKIGESLPIKQISSSLRKVPGGFDCKLTIQ
jgi:hypothetical protein